MEAALAPGERMMGGEIVGESGLAGQQVAPLIPDLTASLKHGLPARHTGGQTVCAPTTHWNLTTPGCSWLKQHRDEGILISGLCLRGRQARLLH